MGQTQRVSGVATTVRGDGEVGGVTYHATEVVKWDRGTVTLNTGGWYTVTTKARMNQAANQFGLGFYVYQKDHQWFVSTCLMGMKADDLEFEDGMEFSPTIETYGLTKREIIDKLAR